MKVREAILMLQDLNPNDEICISWWTKDLFESPTDPLKTEDWECAVDEFDSEQGYDHVNSTVYELIDGAISDHRSMRLRERLRQA